MRLLLCTFVHIIMYTLRIQRAHSNVIIYSNIIVHTSGCQRSKTCKKTLSRDLQLSDVFVMLFLLIIVMQT